MRMVCDVAVIGAGVMGCSIAFHLARLSGTRVIVIDKGPLASGMTKRSGGVVHTHYAVQSEAQLALTSLRYFQNWKDLVGGSCGFTQTGLAVVVQDKADADGLEHDVKMLQSIGVNTQLLSPAELADIQPAAQVSDLALAAYEPESGYLDPVAVTQSLATRAKERGVTFQTGTFAKSIQVDRGRILGVDTTAGIVEALTVVIAAGPWSDRLLRPLDLEIGLRSEHTQVAFFERPPGLKNGHAAFIDRTTGVFFRPHTFGLTFAGMSHWESEAKINPDQFEEAVDPRLVERVRQSIAARLPAMASSRYVRGHTGLYDMSPDGHPILDRAPGIRGLVIAAGFSGVGLAFAPAVGACIAELVTDGAASTVDLQPFRFSRFQEREIDFD